MIFFTRGYVVHFIRNGGNQLIAGILGCLVVAILFRTIYHMAARAFYARQDTKTPLYISIFSISLNIILAIVLSMVLKMGAYGLAWAQSTVAVLEVVILLVVMNRQMPKMFDLIFMQAIFRMVIAGIITGVVCYVGVLVLPFRYHDDSFFSAFPKFVVISMVSFGVYAAASKWLKLSEIDPVLTRLRKMLFGRLESMR